MQKTASKAKSSSSYTRPVLQKSTTLSRKYVRRPVAKKKVLDVKVSAKKSKAVKSDKLAVAKKASVAAPKIKKAVKISSVEKAARAFSAKKSTEKKVIKRTESAEAKAAASDAAREAMKKIAAMESVEPIKRRRKFKVLVAFGLSAVVVAILGVFVAINLPNISVKVVAMQTGIEATYPTFVPRNYTMETVASDKDGKITMKFVGPDDASFTLVEEKSTWDSNAVLNNYVKMKYSANYSTMHEQGITYYSEPGSAVWVNGGILYKITSHGKNLSKEQIRNIVVSL